MYNCNDCKDTGLDWHSTIRGRVIHKKYSYCDCPAGTKLCTKNEAEYRKQKIENMLMGLPQPAKPNIANKT